MSQTNNYVAAIDLGTTKVVTLLAKEEAETGKLQILGFSTRESCGIRKGMIQNVEETYATITQTINEVKQQTGVDFKSVYVGIAGRHIRSINVNGSVVINSIDHQIGDSDVQRLLDDMHKISVGPGEQVLHVIPMNYYVDDDDEPCDNPVGVIGCRLEGDFHIVIGQIAASRLIERCISRCDLQVANLVLEPLASAESVLSNEEKEAGVALIDIGGGTTDLVVYKDKKVCHTAVIPYGGNNITADIKMGCDVLQHHAITLKEKYGMAIRECARPDKIITVPGINGRTPKEISMYNLAGIIQARMVEMLEFVRKEIVRTGMDDSLGAGVVITGGGALLKQLSNLVRCQLGHDVRIGLPSEFLSVDSVKNYNFPQNSTALGLAKIALNDENYCNVKPNVEAEIETPAVAEPVNNENPAPDVNAVGGLRRRFQGLAKMFSEIFDEDESKDDSMN